MKYFGSWLTYRHQNHERTYFKLGYSLGNLEKVLNPISFLINSITFLIWGEGNKTCRKLHTYMAKVNLNKSSEIKHTRGPLSARIKITHFGPHFIKFSKTVSYEVNLYSQPSHLEVLFLSKFSSEWGDFNSCG